MGVMRRWGLSAAGLVTCAACAGDKDTITLDTSGAEPAADVVPTFHDDVGPIFGSKCTGCHQAGGIGPFLLTDYEPARARSQQIADYTANRVMPPFLIDTDGSCGSFDSSVALTDAEIATIGDWAAHGAPEGAPIEITPQPLPELRGGTDFVLPEFAPVAQGTPEAQFDEYRCFPVEHHLAADEFVTGYDVLPGNRAIVHHVLGFIIDPNRRVGDRTNAELMQAMDDESPDRLGWPCFGMAGDGVEVEAAPVTWGPGQGVVDYPGGLGVAFPRDRVLVVQVHYNLADGAPAGRTDQTTVRMRLESSVARQGIFLLYDDMLASLATATPELLAAGKESVVVKWTRQAREMGLPEGVQAELVGLVPHMHGRGRKYTFEIANGGDFECQGRVKRWDFNWQRLYNYTAPPQFTPDTSVRVTCDYDTRKDTAPVLPGWGTRNEMCFAMMMLGLPPGVFF